MQKEQYSYPLTSGNSKVYEVNEGNKKKIESEKQTMYSADNKYALVYDDVDWDKIGELYRFSNWRDYIEHRSREDQIYDDFLYELDPADDTEKFYVWENIVITCEFGKGDTMREFHSERGSVACMFFHQDSISKGSTALFGLTARNKPLLMTIRIKMNLDEDLKKDEEEKSGNE